MGDAFDRPLSSILAPRALQAPRGAQKHRKNSTLGGLRGGGGAKVTDGSVSLRSEAGFCETP